MPSSVTIDEEHDRVMDDYFLSCQSRKYTRINSETGRTEPITPPCPTTPDDTPEGDREDFLASAERRIIPYVPSGTWTSAAETVASGGDKMRRRIAPTMVNPSGEAVRGQLSLRH